MTVQFFRPLSTQTKIKNTITKSKKSKLKKNKFKNLKKIEKIQENIKIQKDHFTLHIETTGSLKPEHVLKSAFDVLRKKLKALKDHLKQLKQH